MGRTEVTGDNPESAVGAGCFRVVLWAAAGAETLAASLGAELQAPSALGTGHVVMLGGHAELDPVRLAEALQGCAGCSVLLVSARPGLAGMPSRLPALPGGPGSGSFLLISPPLEPIEQREWVHRGMTDFLSLPLRSGELLSRLAWHRERVSLATPLLRVKQRIGLAGIVGRSRALLHEVEQVPRIARCNAAVLIAGETGTGKEVFARAIHYLGPRAERPFIPVNGGAIPPELVENELFGHESGAFTGAGGRRAGLIAEADGGTLFLDEIDSLPLAAQVKLLRFLQDQEYRPLGATRSRQADVRVIAAANVDLAAAIRAGGFRADLFYRLNVLSLRLPALRERPEDIPLLAAHFLERFSAAAGRAPVALAPSAWPRLLAHAWPGNVRELENVLQRAVLLAEGDELEAADLQLPEPAELPVDGSFRVQKARMVEEFESRYLRALLVEHRGNISAAARSARKNRRAFWELLRKYRIQPDEFRDARPGVPGGRVQASNPLR